MNKMELKNFAVSSRRDLLEKVSLRAKKFGIDENDSLTIEDKFGQLAINGNIYPSDKKSMFLSLKKQLETKGYEQLIEEVAYTWFNRIIAIRYMEVNEYLPERVNVLSSSTGKAEPDILSQFETMDLNIDLDKIKELSRNGETEEAYRQLFIAQCNALNKVLPFMFEKIQDYTELLLPDYLLDSESVITKLTYNEALTKSFEEVEVIGWLYQFYNTEPKDKVFVNLKKNKKIEKYDIPAATQLFTPKWIVQYMVENSLGHIWLESNPNSLLKKTMRYYIEPAEQDEEVKQKLEEICYKSVDLEEIRIIDPCVGSGHILVYAFDLLYKMYEEAGYPSGDISQLILQKNLFGIDIDDRAAQLASFALMMKAREKSRRIFRKEIELNIYSIQESNQLNKLGIVQMLAKNEEEEADLNSVYETFYNAKNYGSILQPKQIDFDKYLYRIDGLGEKQLTLYNYEIYEQIDQVKKILKQAKVLASRYDVAVTNPPYMGLKGMNIELNDYLKESFPLTKNDLLAVMMERMEALIIPDGYLAVVTVQSWMFLSAFEAYRSKLLKNFSITSLVHMDNMVLGIAFGAVSTILRRNIKGFRGTYQQIKLTDIINNEPKSFPMKNSNYKIMSSSKFEQIPSSPIAYWASDEVGELFKNPLLEDLLETRNGMNTSDNNRFLRFWYEVDYNKIGLNIKKDEEDLKLLYKWFPYNKGGAFRKWYGNREYIVNWENNGHEIKEYAAKLYKSYSRTVKSISYFFEPSITWSALSSFKPSFRVLEAGSIFDNSGASMFGDKETLRKILPFMNTKVSYYLLNLINPTINYQPGNIGKLPILEPLLKNETAKDIADSCVEIAREDWNQYEQSWEFKTHPFLTNHKNISLINDVYDIWKSHKDQQFLKVKANEEELNRIFINLYGLENELTFEVPDEEITIRKADRSKESKSFLSFFIGCVMGRYSLNAGGLVDTRTKSKGSQFEKFTSNKFGLIQLTEEEYFEDDIIALLREFLSFTFSSETVEENLQWLAESLEIKNNESAEERLRRYFLDEFFKDHCQAYQKRPIYWLIDSGKQKGLRTLIYMHRYQPDTMATIRFEHLQEIQAKYNNEIAAVDLRIIKQNLSATEIRNLEKQKTAFQKRLEELLEFDKKLAEYANAQIAIDLDDGVKANYEKFDKVLSKIK